jgi:glutamine amidotransferase PdxT
MNQNIYKFLKSRLTTMRLLGLVDNETTDDVYLNVAEKMFYEQEEKNTISDSKINYNDEIVSIEPVGEMETIDISVTGDSLFFCNDILTKNSIGLAATCDVICSLWQEEEEKELGIINLGMQKNRFGRNNGHCTFKIKYETLTLSETNPDYFSTDSPDSVVNSAESALHALAG